MDKKIVSIIILIIIIIAALVYTYKNNNTVNVNIEATQNITEVNEIKEENTIAENTEIIENVNENTYSADNQNVNTVQNAIIQDNLISSPEKNIYESEKDVGSTNKKQEAINLVKEYWGEDDKVTFTCDSVLSKSEYIVAVVSKKTASVSGYFRVNIDTKTVEVDY